MNNRTTGTYLHTDIHIIHIRWLILIDDAKNLLVESNWGGMVYLWFIDSLIDWFIDPLIPSFLHSCPTFGFFSSPRRSGPHSPATAAYQEPVGNLDIWCNWHHYLLLWPDAFWTVDWRLVMTCHDVIPCLLMFVNRFTLICIVKGFGCFGTEDKNMEVRFCAK